MNKLIQFLLLCSLFASASTLFAQAKPSESVLEVVLTGQPTKKSLVLTTTQPARVSAIEQTWIQGKLAAFVEDVLVDRGDAVKRGQPLVKLRAPELAAELKQKQALLSQAQAELVQAKAAQQAALAAVGTAKSKVVQAESGLARTEADVTRWQAEYKRIDYLAQTGSVNKQIVDETLQKLSAAKAAGDEIRAAVQAAKANISQAESEATSAAAGITTAEARIQVAEANVTQVEVMQAYLTLHAPFDGVVTERRVDTGHFAQPATPLLHIERVDTIRVAISVPEADAAYVNENDLVTLETPAFRGNTITGKVTRTDYVIDAAHRTLETLVDLENKDSRLRPGMFALATITLQEAPDVLTLPAAAVIRQGKDAFCFRYEDGKAVKTPLQLGLKVSDDFEIRQGITVEDTVILNKVAQLKDQQPVNLLPPPKAK